MNARSIIADSAAQPRAPHHGTIIDHAARAVSLAALVCRHVQQRLDALRSMTKDDASPVTIADFASQAVIARGLARAELIGGAGGAVGPALVAEESAEFLKHPDHQAHRHACIAALRESGVWGDCTEDDLVGSVDLGAGDPACLTTHDGGWTLDPVDGTKGFLRAQQYCVSLARIQRGTPTLGLLGCPNLPFDPTQPLDSASPATTTGSIYLAERSEGDGQNGGGGVRAAALHNDHHAPAFLPLARRTPILNRPVVLAESYESAHSNQSAAARVMERAAAIAQSRGVAITLAPPIRIDSQAKYALVARSQADVYLRLPSRKGYIERIWDHAAGTLVAAEACCTVTDARGERLDFSHGRGLERNQGIVGAPPELHACIIQAIDELRPR